MASFIICQPYSATITAASAASTMPASNLNKPQPTDVWRSTSLTSQYIEIDLGSAKAVTIVALMFTNLTSAATWRVQAGTTTGVSNYDSGTVTAWAGATQNVDRPHALLDLTSASKTYRYWKITLTDASNPAGYFEAGRVVLANAFQPTRTYALGAGRGFKDLTERADAFGGQLLYETKAKRPVISFEANWLTEAEMEANVLEIQRTLDGPALVMLTPETTTYRMGRMYYGLLSLEPVVISAFNIFSTRFTVEGLI
jgi:hypothetical protein